jgi:hypothetical protein
LKPSPPLSLAVADHQWRGRIDFSFLLFYS